MGTIKHLTIFKGNQPYSSCFDCEHIASVLVLWTWQQWKAKTASGSWGQELMRIFGCNMGIHGPHCVQHVQHVFASCFCFRTASMLSASPLTLRCEASPVCIRKLQLQWPCSNHISSILISFFASHFCLLAHALDWERWQKCDGSGLSVVLRSPTECLKSRPLSDKSLEDVFKVVAVRLSVVIFVSCCLNPY